MGGARAPRERSPRASPPIVAQPVPYNRTMAQRTKPPGAAPAASPARAAAGPGTLLGGRSVAAFLRAFWHKEALLVRNAIPGVAGLFDRAVLLALAARDDVESRLVVRDGRRWTLVHGPLSRGDWKALPPRNWTLLVQGVNLHSDAADALLRRFSFLPYARLDDLMVSYAVPGGGVGPHFDSYDVFLLQGSGRRRWKYGRQDDLALKRGLPLRILKRIVPEHDDVLGPGDMLYLPPHYAHDGIALTECTTCSIGFRAASTNDMAGAFLDFLRDELDLPGRYADPDLAPTRTPARIGAAMRRQCARTLEAVRWDPATVARFLGCWLSEPKSHVFFEPPAPARSRAAFAAAAAKHGVCLNPRTQLLYDDRHLFINGAAVPWPATGAPLLSRLANARALVPRDAQAVPPPVAALLYEWYRDGFLHSARN
jgi:50S ribosomal protein L16 3-hydroxylase